MSGRLFILPVVDREADRKSPTRAEILTEWLGAALVVAYSLFALAGCAWTGKGKDVSGALEKAGAAKTMTFSGSISMRATDVSAAQTGGQNMDVTFTGAADNGDPAAPRMSIQMDAAGERVSIVMPGDGNVYMSSGGDIVGGPAPAGSAAAKPGDMTALYKALGGAIGDFQEGARTNTKEGLSLRTISAKADSGEICGEVLNAFSKSLDAMSAGSGSLKGLSGGTGGGMKEFCHQLLRDDPRLWFGIDDAGMLRMISLQTKLSMLGMGSLDLSMRYDIVTVDQPVKIEKPRGARMVPSLEQLGSAIGG